MLISLLLCVSLLCTDDCAQCSSSPEIELCKTHQAEEELLIDQLRPSLRGEKRLPHIRALRELGGLSEGHENAPSPRVTRLIGRSLKHDEISIRIAAAEVLRSGQHVPTAHALLLDASKAVREELDQLAEQSKVRGSGGSLEKKVERIGEAAERQAANLRCRVELEKYAPVLARSLAAVPDEATMKELTAFLEYANLRAGAIEALTGIRSKRALELVVGQLAARELEIATTDGPVRSFKAALLQDGHRQLHDELVAATASLGSEAPAYSLRVSELWTGWIEANAARIEAASQ